MHHIRQQFIYGDHNVELKYTLVSGLGFIPSPLPLDVTGTPFIIPFLILPSSCAIAETKHADSMTNYVIFHQHNRAVGIESAKFLGI